MKNQHLVAYYSQVQKLQELGVEFPFTHFFWRKQYHGEDRWSLFWPGITAYNPDRDLPAPTAAELLMGLPKFFQVRKIESGNLILKYKKVSFIALPETEEKHIFGISAADTSAQALATSLIDALERKLITPQQVAENLEWEIGEKRRVEDPRYDN